jgi:hypothetical protein
MDLCCSFLDTRKEPKEIWLKIFCYKFSSIPLLGKNSRCSNSFPRCHFIPLNLFNAKYLMPVNKIQIRPLEFTYAEFI